MLEPVIGIKLDLALVIIRLEGIAVQQVESLGVESGEDLGTVALGDILDRLVVHQTNDKFVREGCLGQGGAAQGHQSHQHAMANHDLTLPV
jgi:hypothetical protein